MGSPEGGEGDPADGAAGSFAEGEESALLLGRARAGDPQALNALYQRYLSPLQRWARGRLPPWARSLADTDDMVQDTLLRSLRGVDAFEAHRTGAFLCYLREGVLNRMRDEMRRAKHRPLAGGTAGAAADPRPSPLEETVGREAVEIYEAALARLRQEDREAIVARLELRLSYRQVAESLGKPSADAARMATTRALERLAEEMVRGR